MTCVEVTATKCNNCGYFAERVRPECREAGHLLTPFPRVKKRFFSCATCKERTTVLNKRQPDSACTKCHQFNWKEAGMKRDASAPPPASEFLPRGEEVGKFRNQSAPPASNPSAAGGGPPTAAHPGQSQHTNAFASRLPTCDG